jgi:hypothetical protein
MNSVTHLQPCYDMYKHAEENCTDIRWSIAHDFLSQNRKFQFWKGSVPLTRHLHQFEVLVPTTTMSEQLHPDKDRLRLIILEMRASGG